MGAGPAQSSAAGHSHGGCGSLQSVQPAPRPCRGDHALREVAHTLEHCIRRPADLAARYGGEEFQVVLPETDLAGARLLAERIRAQVEALPTFAGDERPVTVSIGIGVHVPGTQQDLTGLLGSADEALYRAKANGRNRVEGPEL